jgi:phage terminase large subunit GpA-like protein
MLADVTMDAPAPMLIRAVLAKVRGGYAPPPTLTVSEFSDRELVVTSGPFAGTRWQTDFAPYQRGIMDAHHEPGVEIVVVMGSAQWGKTSIAICKIAYAIAHDPSPVLIVEPTVDPMAKDFSKNRLKPVIDASPILSELVAKPRAKDSSNTTLLMTYRGGHVAIAGANSAASLAARPVRLLVLDEIDRYPTELPGEGNTISIAIKRTTTYRRRRQIMMFSSPTVKDGPIHAWFKRGDQRRYHVPCPHCGHMHALEWKQVRWTEHDPQTARLHCPACDYAIDDAERVAILARGEWRSSTPHRADPSIVSFHMWEAYSPLSSLREIVGSFLRAREMQKTGDKSEMHTWQNTTLGEPIEPDQGEGVETSVLLMRREAVETEIDVPAGACCLTMGVDVQDDRLEALVIGWGPGEESWILDRHTFAGDTEQPEPWAALDELLGRQYRHASGQRLMIHSTCVDSAGHRTTIVYDYAERRGARRVYAIIGRDGQRPIVSSPSPRRWGRGERQVPLYTVGVDAAKSILMSRLALSEKGPGFVHLPHADWCDEEFTAQLTSERLVTRWEKGIPVQFWKKVRARNEALDMAVYALAAERLLNPKLGLMAEALAAAAARGPAKAGAHPHAGTDATPSARPHALRVTRSKYLSR